MWDAQGLRAAPPRVAAALYSHAMRAAHGSEGDRGSSHTRAMTPLSPGNSLPGHDGPNGLPSSWNVGQGCTGGTESNHVAASSGDAGWRPAPRPLGEHGWVGCLFRCGRRANQPYDNCCRACPRRHTHQCRDRMRAIAAAHPPFPSACSHGCGRCANFPYTTCCGACPRGARRHTRDCGERMQMPGYCAHGCGTHTARKGPWR